MPRVPADSRSKGSPAKPSAENREQEDAEKKTEEKTKAEFMAEQSKQSKKVLDELQAVARKTDLSRTVVPYSDVDGAMRARLVRYVGGCWPLTSQRKYGAMPPSKIQRAQAILRDQLEVLKSAQFEGDFKCCAQISAESIVDDERGVQMSKHGVEAINEAIFTTANRLFTHFRGLLSKYGYANNPQGFCNMENFLMSCDSDPEVHAMLASVLYQTTFGNAAGSNNPAALEVQRAGAIFVTSVAYSRTHASAAHWFYLNHLGLPPLQRFYASFPRTIAWVERLCEPLIKAGAQALRRLKKEMHDESTSNVYATRLYWILFVGDYMLENVVFDDVFGFRDGQEITLVLISVDQGREFKKPQFENIKVFVYNMHDYGVDMRALAMMHGMPCMVFWFNTCLANIDSMYHGLYIQRAFAPLFYLNPPPLIALTTECETEVYYQMRIMNELVEGNCLMSIRNCFSAHAGSPDIAYDKNGWISIFQGQRNPESLRRLCEEPGVPGFLVQWLKDRKAEVAASVAAAAAAASEQELAQQSAPLTPKVKASEEEDAEESPVQSAGLKEEAPREETLPSRRPSKTAVVFWGILDLKYDQFRPYAESVQVLETGDGRVSRFSGDGAAIKEKFHGSEKLEEGIRRAVLTENKKLTHDTVVECGYGHLRPRQEAFARVYKEDLAIEIQRTFGVRSEDILVLKLCNRQRGAGVIPVVVSELDMKLQELLRPPSDVEAFFKTVEADWARTVTPGCYQEQLRHWWSNECPIFVVEDFCTSVPTEVDGRQFDGTMRVGFSLHREVRDKLPPGWIQTPTGPLYIGKQTEQSSLAGAQATSPRSPRPDEEESESMKQPMPWNDERPFLDLFRPQDQILRVEWLGGYWKLPIEDTNSGNLRDKIVSVAKKGTAQVRDEHLWDVYAKLGDMVCQLFNSGELGHSQLTKKYADTTYPEFGMFAATRLACSLRIRDKNKSLQVLQLAEGGLAKFRGLPKNAVSSYIHRNFGVHEALQGRWKTAEERFTKSIEAYPANATTRYLLGQCHLQGGSPSQLRMAIQAFEESLLLDPDFKHPYVNAGVAYLRLGEYEEAKTISQACLARHPYTPQCRYNLGVALFALAYSWEHEEIPQPQKVAPPREKQDGTLKKASPAGHTDEQMEPTPAASPASPVNEPTEPKPFPVEGRSSSPRSLEKQASLPSSAGKTAAASAPSSPGKTAAKPDSTAVPIVQMGQRSVYHVVWERVFVRAKPSVKAKALTILVKGRSVRGTPYQVSGEPWLQLDADGFEDAGLASKLQSEEAWVLAHGRCVGIDHFLLEPQSNLVEVIVSSKDTASVVLHMAPDATMLEVKRALGRKLETKQFDNAQLFLKPKNSARKLGDTAKLDGLRELEIANIQLGQYKAALQMRVAVGALPGSSSSSLKAQGGSLASIRPKQVKKRGPNNDTARDLRARAIEALEVAKETKPRDQTWTERDEELLDFLRDDSISPLSKPQEGIPCDGWRTFNPRP